MQQAGCLGVSSVSPCLCSSLQVLVMELSDEKSEHAVSVATVDLLQDREGFTWKGHDRLAPRNGPLHFPPGFQPSVLVQCVPPAAVTAVTLHSEWNLVAFGTSHGFGLFDYYRRNPVLARYGGTSVLGTPWSGTLGAEQCRCPQVYAAPQRLAGHGGAPVPREVPQEVPAPVLPPHPQEPRVGQEEAQRQQPLQQGGHGVGAAVAAPRPHQAGTDPASPPQVQEANAQLAEQAGPPEVEMTPVQRRIEPRSADDSLSGVVRCLYFADTFLRDGETPLPPSPGKRSQAGSVGRAL